MPGAHTDEKDCVTDEELIQYLTGKLNDEEVKVLIARINSCVFCKRKLVLAGFTDSR